MQSTNMISLLQLLFGLFALLINGSPLNSTNVTGTLRWSGEVPGHGFTTFHGSVDSVEQKIFDLNPSLRGKYVLNNPYMSPTPRPFNDTTMSVSNFSYSYKSASGISLQSRDEVNQGISVDQGYGDTHWYCGNFATGSYEEAYEAIARLNAPGGVTGGYWSVPAAQSVSPLVSTCARLVCAVQNGQLAHTAVYWCNDMASEVVAPASVLSSVAAMVASGYNQFQWTGCCLASQNKGTHNQYSGQIFIGNGTNIVVGYGDCTSDNYFVPPNTYAVPGAYGACV